MISIEEVSEEIASLNNQNPTYSVMQKLAAMYIVKDHMTDTMPAGSVQRISDSEFSKLSEGKDKAKVWAVIDDLMNTLSVVNPRLYAGVIREISAI